MNKKPIRYAIKKGDKIVKILGASVGRFGAIKYLVENYLDQPFISDSDKDDFYIDEYFWSHFLHSVVVDMFHLFNARDCNQFI